jgi:hypothetical protein
MTWRAFSSSPYRAMAAAVSALSPVTKGLHSFASQLNLSEVYGIGGMREGCVARIKGVLGDVRDV